MYRGAVHGLILLSICVTTIAALGPYSGSVYNEIVEDVVWCTINREEQRKCEHWANATERARNEFGGSYMKLKCRQSFNKEECMTAIDNDKADLTVLDAGEVFEGGRYHSLVPIMHERIRGGETRYYAVAVIKRGGLPHVSHISHLQGVRACFAGLGTLAGWVIPLYMLMQRGGMKIVDCNNYVKSATSFFGPSCAVNSLIDKYNPIGDNSDKLCELCTGRIPGEKCTSGDPYAGYEGAFKCLRERGDIAFLKHTTVSEMTSQMTDLSGVKKGDFELLCADGLRRSVDDYRQCNWGEVPSHAVVASSVKNSQERSRFQDFLRIAIKLFGNPIVNAPPQDPYNTPNNPFGDAIFNRPVKREAPVSNKRSKRQWNNQFDFHGFPTNADFRNDDGYIPPLPTDPFSMFSWTPRYGDKHNLLFQDSAVDLVDINEDQQTYTDYLRRVMNEIMGIRHCTVDNMVLCVTSQAELDKCFKMRSALKAHLLKPELICSRSHSHIGCMNNIRNGQADVTVLDASDVYTAGLRYGLIPFMAEIYDLGEPSYYAVAVAKEQDPITELTHLKNKNTCHTGINTAAGWVIPMAYLLSNSWIRPYGCDSVRAAAEYFTKSCVPGALSNEYNIGVPYDNMCHLCHGVSHRYCRRDASEDYYGHIGALRCLVEGGGDVAFIKHTTINEIVDGKRAEWWARNALKGDFQLLCPDGRRAPVDKYKHCNLGTAKSNAIVTRGGAQYNETQINAYINLFIYAQQFNGKREADEFSFGMFTSPEPYSDLIFQDATLQLITLNYSQRNYGSYLGQDFLRARRLVDCYASASRIEIKIITLLSPILLYLLS